MTQETILPPLPETNWVLHMLARRYESEWTSYQEGYTAEQMEEYARAAIKADRIARDLLILQDNQ